MCLTGSLCASQMTLTWTAYPLRMQWPALAGAHVGRHTLLTVKDCQARATASRPPCHHCRQLQPLRHWPSWTDHQVGYHLLWITSMVKYEELRTLYVLTLLYWVWLRFINLIILSMANIHMLIVKPVHQVTWKYGHLHNLHTYLWCCFWYYRNLQSTEEQCKKTEAASQRVSCSVTVVTLWMY